MRHASCQDALKCSLQLTTVWNRANILVVGVPSWKLHSQVRSDTPGQIDIVLPLFLTQVDVFGSPVGDAGFY